MRVALILRSPVGCRCGRHKIFYASLSRIHCQKVDAAEKFLRPKRGKIIIDWAKFEASRRLTMEYELLSIPEGPLSKPKATRD